MCIWKASFPMTFAALVAGSAFAWAAPPLIYEGSLTQGGQPPGDWPTLRFSIVDDEGRPQWTREVPEDGPIEVDPDSGHFVAYLDLDEEAPYATFDPEQPRHLQVEVCVAAPNQGVCSWEALGPAQRIGAQPTALALPRRVRVGPGVMYVGDIGTVRAQARLEVELLPVDQNGRFVIEVLGAHNNQAGFIAERHWLLTGNHADGRVIVSNREQPCIDDDTQSTCSSWGVTTAIGDFDADGVVELRVNNQHELALYTITVLIRGVGTVLDFGAAR